MEKRIKNFGIAAVGFGLAASMLCLVTYFKFQALFLAILMGFTGFICTNIYIVLNNKYQVNKEKINPGIAGLILNSIPMLFVFIILYFVRKQH
ncbi:MAG: hypothetical protein ABI199_07615 [Bacteroidia bacterium]